MGSGSYRLSRTTTTNSRGILRFRSSFSTPSLVKVFGQTARAFAVPVMSGLMKEMAFQERKFTTRSAWACWRDEGADSGVVTQPAKAMHAARKRPNHNLLLRLFMTSGPAQ